VFALADPFLSSPLERGYAQVAFVAFEVLVLDGDTVCDWSGGVVRGPRRSAML
jgi:hypothetical protein